MVSNGFLAQRVSSTFYIAADHRMLLFDITYTSTIAANTFHNGALVNIAASDAMFVYRGIKFQILTVKIPVPM